MTDLTKQLDPLPARARAIGMGLFLASLAMLFAAAILGYILVRLNAKGSAGAATIPWPLALSTAALVAGSITIERAVRLLDRERIAGFRAQLLFTLLLCLAFIAVQTPSLLAMLRDHETARGTGVTIHGLVFVLILLHGLHVLGGLIPLIVVIRGAAQGRYDHENTGPVRSLATYWHFLLVVWLAMLGVFAFVR